MPGWAKGVIAIGVLAGVGLLAYKLFGTAKDLKKSTGSRKESGAVNDELNKLTQQGKGPTLSSSQLLQSANQLFTFMDGYGTNETGILGVFGKAKNDGDVLGIIKAYGIRELSSGRLNPEPNLKATLGEALASELSTTWLSNLNKTLELKAIKFRF